ncbi:MAG TPA: glucose 1-dehydrogenase [Capillimicrobium sp.]|nr:glucose 1-dehydrogenase [Capillimicrobium sp.]
MTRLDGKVAVITGAALERGQGACEARLFAQEGATVVLTDVQDEAGRATAAAIGDRAEYVRLDVTDAAAWEEVVRGVVERHGRIDVLVNNAGIWHTGGLLETSPDEFRRVVEINQTGVFLGMWAVAPLMRDQGSGSIVNISSSAGLRGDPRIHAYVASKWAVRGMTKAAALELAPFGVRVNSVHPGLIQTPMSATEFEPGKPDPGRNVPMKRVGQPEEVAELVCYLASDASAYVTGAEVAIDGAVTV